MAGNKAGGKKAAKTNIERHGEDFYKVIGAKGGSHSSTGGFYSDKVGEDGLTGRERAVIAGRKGGLKSKRGPAKPKEKAEKKGIVERIFGRKDA